MKVEQLLKGISDSIKRHEDFLAKNPDVFIAIQDRLMKAIDDEYEAKELDFSDAGLEEGYYDAMDEGLDDSYGDSQDYHVESDTLDEDLFQDYPELKQENLAEEPQDNTAQDITTSESNPSSKDQAIGRGTRWKPRDLKEAFKDIPGKAEELQTQIDDLINEGYTHREAEKLVGAHEQYSLVGGRLLHRIQPDEPSEKMLDMLRGYSVNSLSEYHSKLDQEADKAKNPVKYASGINRQKVKDMFSDYHSAVEDFKNSEEFNAMDEDDQDDALDDFYNDWHSQNKEKMITGDTAKDEAKQARMGRLEEQRQALMSGGAGPADSSAIAGEASSRSIEEESAHQQLSGAINEFMQSDEYMNMSEEEQEEAYDDFVDHWTQQNAPDEQGSMTDEAGIQMAGGARDQEGQAQVGIERNPFAAAAGANPELASQLKEWKYGDRKKRVQEIASKNPEVLDRINQLGIKKPSGEEE